MFRILRKNTVQTAIRQFNTLNKQTVSKSQQLKAGITLSNYSKRYASTKGSSDNTMYLLGAGVLVGSTAFAYFAINTEYIPEKPRKPETSIEQKPTEEVQEETPVDIEESNTISEAPVEKETSKDTKTASDTTPELLVSAPNEAVLETITGIPYVIVGAGTAAHAACRAIRKNQPNAKILVIGEETVLPYMRPPLSKELWFSDDESVSDTLLFKSWDGKERSVFFESKDFYTAPSELKEKDDGGVSVITGSKVTDVNADEHLLTLSNGQKVQYEKLLLATGGKPKNMPIFDSGSADVKKRTTLFRNVADFKRLEKVVKENKNIVVIGGGFLGSELACALSVKGKSSGANITQIYPEEGNMAKVLPQYLSEWTTQKVKNEGVNVIGKNSITQSKYEDNGLKLTLSNGDTVSADHVIVCVGIEPNVELAKPAGLEIDPVQGGFRVNAELEARSDIWVAGDAACFYDVNLGRRRVEHHDHAVVSGRLAGENMTGAKKIYKHQSMFWSDLGPEVGYEAIGLVDSTLPTVGVWAKATDKDTPKAAAEATGEGIRSEVNSEEESSADDKAPTKQEVAPPASVKEDFGKGVVFYMREKKIVGILLWNIFSQMPVARRIISEGKDHEDLNATARLFKIHG